MSLLLEVLVAKGRRVQNPREQREVAFGLADLSTNAHQCIRIAAKGGIPTLVRLLCISKDVETQRLSALALSNLASFIHNPSQDDSEAESIESNTIKEEEDKCLIGSTKAYWETNLDCIQRIIHFLKDDGVDTVTRRYGALLFGNLAADVDLHSHIMEWNGISTLVGMLNFALVHQDLELGRCTAFALAQFTVASVFTSLWITSGILESLVQLTCAFTQDWAVQTQALVALRGIMCDGLDRNSSIQAVQHGLLDSLVLMARSKDDSLRQEVACTLYSLSTVDRNKKPIAQVAFATILSLALSGMEVMEQYASSTLANVVESIETHPAVMEHRGILSTLSILASQDLVCKSEGCRALANLTANIDTHHLLLDHECFERVVDILANSNDCTCLKYAALTIANLSANALVHNKVIHLGGVGILLSFVHKDQQNLEARRYALLSLANLTASDISHAAFVESQGLRRLLALANSIPDALSQFYIARTLRNISSNFDHLSLIVKEDWIPSLILFSLSDDPDIRLEGVAALRSLSTQEEIQPKIIQEGGLNQIRAILETQDVELLLEVTAYLCNLSFGTKARVELAKSPIIPFLLTHVLNEHEWISRYCCTCLAHLAEIYEIHGELSTGETLDILIAAMRNRDDIVRRESGRALANILAGACINTTDLVIEKNGHLLFISFLFAFSPDSFCQRVGALGISNLCVSSKQKDRIASANALEPLRAIADYHIDIECQRFALLAMAKLASAEETHLRITQEGIVNVVIPLTQSTDFVVRNYSAIILSCLAQNPLIRQRLISEGGLEGILLLARTSHIDIQREVLPAITSLTFIDGLEKNICVKGGLGPIITILGTRTSSLRDIQLCCCAIANLSAILEVLPLLVNADVIPLIAQSLSHACAGIENEVFRSICNFAACADYSREILKHNTVTACLMKRLGLCHSDGLMFTLGAAVNLARTEKGKLFDDASLTLLIMANLEDSEWQNLNGDSESLCMSLYLLLNLSANTPIPKGELSTLVGLINRFSANFSMEIRRSAILLLGNLCAHSSNHEQLCMAALPIIISSSFPTGLDTNRLSHFQAIAGLRGLASNSSFRIRLIEEGGLEPLFLTLSKKIGEADPKTIREATICIFNITFSSITTYDIVRSGMIEILSSVTSSGDKTSRAYAIASLGNLAEYGTDIQDRIIENGCWAFAMDCASQRMPYSGALHEAARVLALLSTNTTSHTHFIGTKSSFFQVFNRKDVKDDMFLQRCGIFIMGNLARDPNNHGLLIDCDLLPTIASTILNDDILYKRCIAYTLKHLSGNIANHQQFDNTGILQLLIHLLRTPCNEIQLEACLSLRILLTTEICRTHFIDLQGHADVFRSFDANEPELTREGIASLWNLSISNRAKIEIFASSGWSVLLEASRSQDEHLAYAACHTVANISEASEIQEQMVASGIVHNLTFAMRTSSSFIIRESVRTLANLSSNMHCTLSLVKFAVHTPLVKSLSSPDAVCIRFATMALSNLTVTEDSQLRLLDEGGLPLLFALLRTRESEWTLSQQWAFITLTNLSSCSKCHDLLLVNGIIDLIEEKMSDSQSNIKTSALRCLSNLSSNPRIHEELHERHCLDILMRSCSNGNIYEQPLVASVLRGLSQSEELREKIITEGFLQSLITVCNTSHTVLHDEILSTFCNISATQCFARELYDELGFKGLEALLNKDERVPRLFAVLLLGNLIRLIDLHELLIKSVITPIIRLSREADDESLRCVGLTLCNILAKESLHADVIQEGGIEPIVLLLLRDCADVFRALKALRHLATFPQHREDMIGSSLKDILIELVAVDRNMNYFEEVTAIFYYLSLDDFCKESIVQSELLRQFAAISDRSPTDGLTPMTIRVVSNCCELSRSHPFVISFVSILLTMSLNIKDCSTVREVARLFSNISSSSLILMSIDNEQWSHYLIHLCESEDGSTCEYGHLSVLNTYLMSKNYWSDDQRQNLVKCYSRMIMAGSNNALQQSSFKRLSLHLLSHCTTIETARFMTIVATSDLSSGDLEAGFSASYALRKAKPNREMMQAPSFTLALNDFMSKADPMASCHAIAILRKLCEDEQFSKNLLCSNSIIHSLFDTLEKILQTSADALLSREIVGCLFNITSHGCMTYGLLEGLILNCAAPLCMSSDDECCRWAVGLLANVTDELDYHIILKDSGIASIVLHLMVHGILLVKREACRLMCNLLTSNYYQNRFTELNFTHGLMAIVITMDDELCLHYVGLSLNKLASVYSNGDYLLCEEVFSCIQYLMKSSCLKVTIPVCKALKCLSVNDKFKDIFIKGNILQMALAPLCSNSVEIRRNIAETIFNVTLNSLLQRWLFEEGIVEHFVKACYPLPRDVSLVVTCVGVIENLAIHEENRNLMLKHNELIMFLFELTNDDRLEIQEQAAKLFSVLTSQRHRLMQVHEPQLLDALTKHLSDPNRAMAKYAAITIGNIAGYCQRELVSSDIVEGLIGLLGVPQSSIYACKALSLLLNQNFDSVQYAIDKDHLIAQLLHLCSSDCKDEQTQALITICNLSQYVKSHSKLMKYGLMTIWKTLKPFPTMTIQCTAAKLLGNLCRSKSCLSHIYKQRILRTMLETLSTFSDESVINIIWSLCSICSQIDYASRSCAESEEVNSILFNILTGKYPMQRAIPCLLYNLSMLDLSNASKLLIFETFDRIGHCEDQALRQIALMILLNLSADRYKQAADVVMRDGRLQWIISKMKEGDLSVKTIACLCLSNISVGKRMQSSMIALGPLHLLIVYLVENKNSLLQLVAALCLVNMCTNESMWALVKRNGVIEHLCSYAKSKSINDVLSCFMYANMSPDISLILLNEDGFCIDKGIDASIRLTRSQNLYVASIAMSMVTKWAMNDNSAALLALLGNYDFLYTAFKVPEVSSIDMERDIAIFILFLSRPAIRYNWAGDVRIILYRLYAAISSADKVVVRNASVTLANIAERMDYHDSLLKYGALSQIHCFIRQDCSTTKCEAMRALIHILKSADCCIFQVIPLLDAVIFLKHKKDEAEEYFTALVFRKMSAYDCCQLWFLKEGLTTLLTLLRSLSVRTIRHGARAFRNLCSNERNVTTLNQTDGVDEILISLLKHETLEIKCIGLSVLSDLVAVSNAASKVSGYGVSLIPLLSRIKQSQEDLNARIVHVLVSISEYRTNQDNGFLIRSIDALIRFAQSENAEIRQNVTHALFNFAANENNQITMYHQGCFPCLMKLCELEDHACQRYSQLAICFLMTNPQVHKRILKEYDMIHELIVTANTSSPLYQSLAASSISSISTDEDVKARLMKKDALQSIFRLTGSPDLDTRYDALFAIANFVASSKFHHAIIDAGGIQLLNQIESDCDVRISSCIARFFALLSINNEVRTAMIQEDVVVNLLHLTRLEDPVTQQYSLISLSNLCYGSVRIGLKSFQPIVPTLLKGMTHMSMFPNISFNNSAALMMTGISLLYEGTNMPTIISASNIRALLDMLRFSHDETQVYACTALNLVFINDFQSIQEEILYSNHMMSNFMSLVECTDEDYVLSGLLALGSICEKDQLRIHVMKDERCISAVVGTMMNLNSSIPVLRAAGYFICMIAESVEHHSILYKVGALESVIHLMSQIDEECRDYGTFAIACLSQTKNLQVPLTKQGAIRPLVNILASDGGVESKHYAALALLRLADNFENHITIAEEGGIRALIEMGGRSQYMEIQTRASLSLGQVATTLASKVHHGMIESKR